MIDVRMHEELDQDVHVREQALQSAGSCCSERDCGVRGWGDCEKREH